MLTVRMPQKAFLPLLTVTLLAIILLVPAIMEWRTRLRIAKELETLGGEVLEVRRTTEIEDLVEAPHGSLYEVNYLNRWGRKSRRRCRAGWFGRVEWLRAR